MIGLSGYHPRMSTGTGVASPAPNPHGRYDPDLDNFYCHFCRSYVQAPPSQGLRECPTPGCKRPLGFGKFAAVARPPKITRKT